MNLANLGVIADVAATIAVFVTLVYLSIQVRTGNKQAEMEALRQTFDGINQFCDLIVASKQTASVLNRGREDFGSLDGDERTQFEHLHVRLLNTLEAWYRQVEQTSRDEDYQKTQFANIKTAVQMWLGNSGGVKSGSLTD